MSRICVSVHCIFDFPHSTVGLINSQESCQILISFGSRALDRDRAFSGWRYVGLERLESGRMDIIGKIEWLKVVSARRTGERLIAGMCSGVSA